MKRIIAPLLALVCLAACHRAPSAPVTVLKQYTIDTGDTLSASLENTGLPEAETAEIIQHLSTVFNPRYCRPGDTYSILTDTSAHWQRFQYHQKTMEFYALEKSSAGAIIALKKTKPFTTHLRSASGRIKGTLWEAMTAQGMTPELIMNFADIFAWQIDFLTEPRAGDTFRLIWEQHIADDGQTINGTIKGAQYTASGKEHTAIFFTHPDGSTDYYDIAGDSLRRAFLRAPLQFRRISSFFTLRRFHPVLKYFRPHLGIDYAAPKGTPVSAVANGTVTFAGYKGGFGKFIHLRHANGYETSYGHLNGYARGIRSGARVSQGQLIGYVGATGLATGPHLDFRIQLNGKYFNYLTMKFPASESIPRQEQAAFKQTMQDTLTRLSQVK